MPIAYPAGSVIPHAKLIVFRKDGTEIIGVNLVLPELTDTQKLSLDLEKIEETMAITGELALPKLEYAIYSDITISAELTDYVTYSGGIFEITRPDGATGDVTGTLSFLITVGSSSQSVTVTLTVQAESSALCTDLFISEYIEGSSYNKYIEIYNGTEDAIDLSTYTLELYSNGSATVSYSMTLSGILNPGKVVIIHHASAALSFTNPDGITLINSTVINFNGDDAIVLKHNGTVIDAIGKVGEKPSIGYWGDGTIISTKDRTLVRNPNICSGRTDPSTAFDPAAEWISYPSDTATQLGFHEMN
jgi:hypothetical protein